eukprot:3783198-Amphidinium_carterae.1
MKGGERVPEFWLRSGFGVRLWLFVMMLLCLSSKVTIRLPLPWWNPLAIIALLYGCACCFGERP